MIRLILIFLNDQFLFYIYIADEIISIKPKPLIANPGPTLLVSPRPTIYFINREHTTHEKQEFRCASRLLVRKDISEKHGCVGI